MSRLSQAVNSRKGGGNGSVNIELTLDQKSVNDLIRKFQKFGLEFDRRTKLSIGRRVANKTIVPLAKSKAPVAEKAYKRYVKRSAGGASLGLRAEKGKDTVPGTLKRSIKAITFRRSDSVFAGPKVKGKDAAWYGHFQEFGTKGGQGNGKEGISAVNYMSEAYNQSKGIVKSMLVSEAEAFLKRKAKRLKLTMK